VNLVAIGERFPNTFKPIAGNKLKILSPVQEIIMLSNRLFNVLLALALVVVAAITLHQVGVTQQVVAASQPMTRITEAGNAEETATCAFSDADRHSLHAVYVPEMGGWLPRTDSGFTGFEGGLLSLRDC
jgi:hypothetical protein